MNLITKILLTALFLFVSCQAPQQTNPVNPPSPGQLPRGSKLIETNKEIVVGAYLVKCSCFIEKQCLVLDGQSWCDGIKGFQHEEGVEKTIIVDVYKNPEYIQDIGDIGYIFRKIIEEKPVKK